jgi:hypothetical protein
MSQIATKVFTVQMDGASEVDVFSGSRIIFAIDMNSGGLQVMEFTSSDGNTIYLRTGGTAASYQANMLFDKGLKIRTQSGAGASHEYVVFTSADGA